MKNFKSCLSACENYNIWRRCLPFLRGKKFPNLIKKVGCRIIFSLPCQGNVIEDVVVNKIQNSEFKLMNVKKSGTQESLTVLVIWGIFFPNFQYICHTGVFR